MKTLSILGATGSIGTQSLAVIDAFPSQFKILGLSAGQNISLFKKQLLKYKPQFASVQRASDAKIIQDFIKTNKLKTHCLYGKEGLNTIASQSQDLLVVSIFGSTAIYPTYLAIKQGTHIALASKEILVSAGDFIMKLAHQHDVCLLPIDSEHAALKQCLSYSQHVTDIETLTLTASGGPFWQLPRDAFPAITKKQALKHPNWDMGAKITIDSATMMNKGFEVIEAHHLFDVDFRHIDVVIHPQSIIHSLVTFIDGTTLSQMSLPDMRLPIQYALTYPKKFKSPWPKSPLTDLKALTFHPPDFSKFPLLKLAFEAGQKGGSYPTVLNAANDVAVDLFLTDKISFIDIAKMVEKQLSHHDPISFSTIEDIMALDEAIKIACSHVSC